MKPAQSSGRYLEHKKVGCRHQQFVVLVCYLVFFCAARAQTPSRVRERFSRLEMDVMALKCRSLAALAVPSKGGLRYGEVQQSGGAAVKFNLSFARRSAVSAGAHCSARPAEDGCFSEAVLSTSLLRGRGKTGVRDWRAYSSGNGSGQIGEDNGRLGSRFAATVEKANDVGATEEKNMQMFGPSESSCDEGSSYVTAEKILENEGGKSIEDYKLRAHVFSESDLFFSALKDRNNSHSVN